MPKNWKNNNKKKNKKKKKKQDMFKGKSAHLPNISNHLTKFQLPSTNSFWNA